MASTPAGPDLGPHTGVPSSGSTSIVPSYREPDGTQEMSTLPDPQPRRRFPFGGFLIGGALVVLVVLASVTFARFIDPPTRDAGATDGRPAAPPGPERTVSAPLGDTRAAEFQLAAGVTAVVVRAADLGGDLYRASTPDGSGFVPRVARDGDVVKLRLANVLDNGTSDTVTMELNQRVKWRITLVGGSESASVDLRSAAVAGVDFIGGVARIELWLPKPQGEVAVRMLGGAQDFVVRTPMGVPVRVVLTRGAASVTVDGVKRTGVVAGTRLVPTGWETARDRYTVDAVAGLATLTVSR
jgi:hypothetical protein